MLALACAGPSMCWPKHVRTLACFILHLCIYSLRTEQHVPQKGASPTLGGRFNKALNVLLHFNICILQQHILLNCSFIFVKLITFWIPSFKSFSIFHYNIFQRRQIHNPSFQKLDIDVMTNTKMSCALTLLQKRGSSPISHILTEKFIWLFGTPV